MLVEPEVDSGPILRTARLPISPSDTTGQLTEKLSTIGGQLLVETLRDWTAGLIDPQPQDHSRATFSRKASKADGQIDWTLSAEVIDRRIPRLPPLARFLHDLVRPQVEDHRSSPDRRCGR